MGVALFGKLAGWDQHVQVQHREYLLTLEPKQIDLLPPSSLQIGELTGDVPTLAAIMDDPRDSPSRKREKHQHQLQKKNEIPTRQCAQLSHRMASIAGALLSLRSESAPEH